MGISKGAIFGSPYSIFMAYLYRHIRLDKNIPFYIGIGSDSDGTYRRAYRKDRNNKHWVNIIKKHPYEVEILLDDLTWEEACIKEIEFIKLYGRKSDGGCLVNITCGGDGFLGLKPVITPERNKKISETSKAQYANGRKKIQLGVKWSEEKKAKHKAWLGRTHSEESKKLMSEKAMGNKKGLGKPCSEEKKRKISAANKGKVHTEERRLKNSLSKIGLPSPRKGVKLTEETKRKISISKKGKKQRKATIKQPTLTKVCNYLPLWSNSTFQISFKGI